MFDMKTVNALLHAFQSSNVFFVLNDLRATRGGQFARLGQHQLSSVATWIFSDAAVHNTNQSAGILLLRKAPMWHVARFMNGLRVRLVKDSG